ncbi:hypothetical protein ACP70R_029050 [Stipagrostis hirtigluma subsp. patula]
MEPPPPPPPRPTPAAADSGMLGATGGGAPVPAAPGQRHPGLILPGMRGVAAAAVAGAPQPTSQAAAGTKHGLASVRTKQCVNRGKPPAKKKKPASATPATNSAAPPPPPPPSFLSRCRRPPRSTPMATSAAAPMALTTCSMKCLRKIVNYTQELYKQREPKGRYFTLLHCWALLQSHPKWVDRNLNPLKKKGGKSSSPEDNDELDDMDGTPCSTPSSSMADKKRPSGRKQEKERLKRGGEGGVVYKEAIEEMIATRKELEADKKIEKQMRWEEVKMLQERQVAYEE